MGGASASSSLKNVEYINLQKILIFKSIVLNGLEGLANNVNIIMKQEKVKVKCVEMF